MTCVIISTAAALNQVNQLLRDSLGATGDNVSVPIVVETAGKDEAPQLYGCNWEAFSDSDFLNLKKLAKDVQGMYVYDGAKEKGFDHLLKRLRIKRKESEL